MTSSLWVSLLATILDRIKWNSKPPSLPNQGWSHAKGKTCHFFIFDLRGGRGRGSKFFSYFVPLAWIYFSFSLRSCIVLVFNCHNLLYICYMNPLSGVNLELFLKCLFILFIALQDHSLKLNYKNGHSIQRTSRWWVKIVFLTVQYNEADRNCYFAGTDQGLDRLGGILDSFLTYV